ncbi:MAG: multidrug effflux MFS transporter [Bosea sp. (in: a-proteobacteria)]|jgi:DHA1 family bicyclomycin/chloramphenicol resistance-like MFS transporter|uniref:multidrug effflux MFS transporter n=1 Tax=unclassified Bosea (in: a-proteobacteria) TaxID=2653178 RepID=UPI00083E106C|nr:MULTISPECIES: multidrug effflux MFS transporter [unclassified Bosea (in: a-proteobacteria)]AOG06171.1 drug resistance transporter, Bcr/CflA subfamily protein [Bosea sp. RAC05]MBA4269653.1 MFS transporter [Methylobacterium sp.]MBX9876487.1 multidrug effflux MFS transporter [Beijerinckiaceae bacterium]MDP3602666.1 multidrug effflux MFS transporter [Bosea sp. (in: a-proteobacteria)]
MSASTLKPTLTVLVAMSALQPIALNLLAPAAPALSRHFGSSYATIQLALTLFLVAVALTQLVSGPLSDRFGRRPCVNAGIALFIAGSALGALAPSIEILLLARILEGAGSGSVFALSRAIIRDTANRDEAASQIATVTMVMVIAPMIAPWLGGQIETAFGWRMILWFMTVSGVIVLLLTLVKLPETAPNLGERTPLLGVFRAFPTLIVNRVFVLNVIAVSTSSAAFFAFIAAAPYIVVETMGRGSDTYGAYFILNAAGYMVGNYAMARLVMKIGAPRMVHLGLVISSIAMTVAVPLSLRADWSPIMLFLPLALNAIGNGMTIPGSTAEALSARPDLAGSAAGLMGALQLGFSALMTVAISLVVTIWPPSLVVLMWLLTIIGMIAIHFGRRGAAARG